VSRAWPVAGLNPHESVRWNAQQILAVRFDELISHAGWITDQELVTELHDARISAKRLRYTLEFYEQVLESDTATAIAELASLQDALGNVHDVDFRIEMIGESLVETENPAVTEEIRSGLESLLQKQLIRRSKLYGQAVELWVASDLDSMKASLLQ
jgi:CHAD domain-containing protein